MLVGVLKRNYLSLIYLITLSLEKEIYYCVRNLEFCDPKICTNPGKKRMSYKCHYLTLSPWHIQSRILHSLINNGLYMNKLLNMKVFLSFSLPGVSYTGVSIK